jgi:hypothetical protein
MFDKNSEATPPRASRRRLSLRRRLAFALASVVLATLSALALGEAWVRATCQYWTPEMYQSKTLLYDSVVFERHAMRPNQTVVNDGVKVASINSHGYRGPEFSSRKPAGTTRVIFVGGSFVFSWPPSRQDDLARARAGASTAGRAGQRRNHQRRHSQSREFRFAGTPV